MQPTSPIEPALRRERDRWNSLQIVQHSDIRAVAFPSRFPLNSSMLDTLLKKFVGSSNDREVKKIQPIVQKINELELEFRLSPTNNSRPRPPNSNNDSKTERRSTICCPRLSLSSAKPASAF